MSPLQEYIGEHGAFEEVRAEFRSNAIELAQPAILNCASDLD